LRPITACASVFSTTGTHSRGNSVGLGEKVGASIQGNNFKLLSCDKNNDSQLGKCFNNKMTSYSQKGDTIKIQGWIIDSGATDHMTHEQEVMINKRKSQKDGIINANGEIYPVTETGDIKISSGLNLKNALLVPSLATNLISVGQLTQDLNCVALIFPSYCVFQNLLTKEIIGHGIKRDGLYYLDDSKIGRVSLAERIIEDNENKVMLWHKRLGHPSFGHLKKLSPHLFLGLDNKDFSCKTCVEAKSHRTSYFDSMNKSIASFDLIHTDVWGPSPVMSKSMCRWYVIFIDDCTRMMWLYNER
jgi:GAG-pre-integrase domain